MYVVNMRSKKNRSSLQCDIRDGATGRAGWTFILPVFQRSEAKNPSKLQISCNLYVPTVNVAKI